MTKRLVHDNCFAVLVDMQEYFLSSLDAASRTRIEDGTVELAKLLTRLRIPLVMTEERPVSEKGRIPRAILETVAAHEGVVRLEKEFFDLTRHAEIVERIGILHRKQTIVAGCETDVCVLQSCLGLLDLGYDVFVVEDLIFSSSSNVEAAVARMKAEGVVFMTYKTLFYELVEAIEGSDYRKRIEENR